MIIIFLVHLDLNEDKKLNFENFEYSMGIFTPQGGTTIDIKP